jgi:hypothetical protein
MTTDAKKEYILRDAQHCPVLLRQVYIVDISLLAAKGVLRDRCIELGRKRLAEFVSRSETKRKRGDGDGRERGSREYCFGDELSAATSLARLSTHHR